jgi:hypothetical protein
MEPSRSAEARGPDLTESKKIDLDSWRSRPVFVRGRDWLWSYFGEVF